MHGVVEHVGCGFQCATFCEKVADPDGAEHVWIEVFSKILDEACRDFGLDTPCGVRLASVGEEQMIVGVVVWEELAVDGDEFLQVLGEVGEVLGNIDMVDVGVPASCGNLEFVPLEVDVPVAFVVLVDVTA